MGVICSVISGNICVLMSLTMDLVLVLPCIDYNLLEEVKRMAESAQRLRKKLCPYTHPYYRLPFHLKSLRTAASSRRTKIMFLPTGMTKREKNQTRYDKRLLSLYLSIYWLLKMLHHHTLSDSIG